MKRHSFIFAAFLLFYGALIYGLFSQTAAYAQNETKNSENLYPKNSVMDITNNYYKLEPIDRYKFMTKSLKNVAVLKGIYYTLFAEDIFPMDKNFAAFLYTLGFMRSYQDSLMCADETAKDSLALFSEISPKASAHAQEMSGKDFLGVLEYAIEWDKENPKRPDPDWMCINGKKAAGLNSSMEILPAGEYQKKQEQVKKIMLKNAKKSSLRFQF
ncbi:MAG: hypothetical protein LUE64_07025 [Candidatus Gastranaerophilales bacterium]|nr:hypothetical protein [Candidatus Gastranaerophilales bacterium]